MDIKTLISEAFEAQKNSYSPYSSCKVGAALLCKNGGVYKGCNIENASFPATVCAERAAFFNAVLNGENSFDSIAVVGNNGKDKFFYPCGVCRQVMSEFCDDDFKIIVAKSISEYEIYSLAELLPHKFSEEDVL